MWILTNQRECVEKCVANIPQKSKITLLPNNQDKRHPNYMETNVNILPKKMGTCKPGSEQPNIWGKNRRNYHPMHNGVPNIYIKITA